MPSSIINFSSPYVVLPSGVARVYDRRSFISAAEAALKPAGRVRPGQTWSEVSQKNRQALVLEEFNVKTQGLAEGIRIFDLPDRTNLGYFRAARSSAPDKITAEALDRAPTGLHYAQVEYLAQAQTNTSAKLISTAAPALDPGDYTFDLEVNGETIEVNVSVVHTGSGSDTNEDLLDKIGRQVMAADDRLEAFVVKSDEPDENGNPVERSALVIRSGSTGRDVTFSLSDTSGELVETLKLDTAGPAAGPARLRFDNQVHDSDTDALSLEDYKLALNLLQPTGPSETINIEKGTGALINQTKDLVGRFNDYVDFLKGHKQNVKMTIFQDIMTEMDSKSRRLRDIGLPPVGDGGLVLTPRYSQILEGDPEYVRDVLTGPEGFFTGVKNVLDGVLDRKPSQYGREIQTVPRTYQGGARFFQALRTGLNLSVSA